MSAARCVHGYHWIVDGLSIVLIVFPLVPQMFTFDFPKGCPWLSVDGPWAIHGYHWITHGSSMVIIGLPQGLSMVIIGLSMGHPWTSLDYPWFIHGYHWITAPQSQQDIRGTLARPIIAERHSGYIGTPHNRRKTFGAHWHAP